MAAETEEELLDRLNRTSRFGLYEVPDHLRQRLNAVARVMGVKQTEALGACIQAAEAALAKPLQVRYLADLRRWLCAPPNAKHRTVLLPSDLLPIPVLDPPLGVSMGRWDLFVNDRYVVEPVAPPPVLEEAKEGDEDDQSGPGAA